MCTISWEFGMEKTNKMSPLSSLLNQPLCWTVGPLGASLSLSLFWLLWCRFPQIWLDLDLHVPGVSFLVPCSHVCEWCAWVLLPVCFCSLSSFQVFVVLCSSGSIWHLIIHIFCCHSVFSQGAFPYPIWESKDRGCCMLYSLWCVRLSYIIQLWF